jgi:hypothetical protein
VRGRGSREKQWGLMVDVGMPDFEMSLSPMVLRIVRTQGLAALERPASSCPRSRSCPYPWSCVICAVQLLAAPVLTAPVIRSSPGPSPCSTFRTDDESLGGAGPGKRT